MKIFLLIICFFSFYIKAYSQGYLNLKKSKIVSMFSKGCIKDSLQYKVSDKGDLLTLSLEDPTNYSYEIICGLNKKERCTELTFIFYCDSCSKISMTKWLSSRSIRWHKINSNNYISGAGHNLYLTIMSKTSYSVKVLKSKEYVKIRKDLKLKENWNASKVLQSTGGS